MLGADFIVPTRLCSSHVLDMTKEPISCNRETDSAHPGGYCKLDRFLALEQGLGHASSWHPCRGLENVINVADSADAQGGL